jgi:hypothetical protein
VHGHEKRLAAIARTLLAILIIFVQPGCAGTDGRAPPSSADGPGPVSGRKPGNRNLALLVGINEYRYPHIGNLNGAINDVANMKRLLVERFDFPDDDEHIRVLTNEQATRGAILAAIEAHLISRADPNSIVVFHYSGHGSYLTDTDGDETDGLDETIVPYDSGHIEPYPNRDITDDELNALLGRLADKTPNVTFIFDSCHSGTAVRGAGRSRTTRPDRRVPREPRYGAAALSRGVKEGASDLRPVDARYALISATMAGGLAYELHIDGQSYGAMTWTLADEIRRAGGDATYRDIMEIVKARVTARYPTQLPQLEGPGIDQFVFSSQSTAPAAYVAASPLGNGLVTLEAGQVHGVTAGSIYAVYPPGTRSFTAGIEPVARIKVSRVDVGWSIAQVISGTVSRDGSRAVELEHHWPDAVQRIYFEGLDASVVLQQIRHQLREFRHIMVVDSRDGYDMLLREVRDDNDAGRYIATEGADPTEISPRVAVNDSDAVGQVVAQLTHWAKWFNILRIGNSPPGLGVDFRLRAVQGTGEDTDAGADRDLNLTLTEGERLFIETRNTSNLDLYIALLDLSSDGSVDLVYPAQGEQEFLAPGKTWSTQLDTFVPPGRESVRDVLKLIATTNYVDFGFLRQGAVRGGPRLAMSRGRARNPLEELLANAATGTTRGVSQVEVKDWVTEHRILEVRRRD